jgi:chromate transporter
MSTSLTPADWIGLFTHFTALSLLAVGGVITTVPDMQRYLVADQHWLTDSQLHLAWCKTAFIRTICL